MILQQHTLNNSIKAKGIGLHTGRPTFIIIKPAPPDTGIVFEVMHFQQFIPAKTDYIGNTHFSTSLIKDGIQLYTIEHLLSALAGLNIDNALIQIHTEFDPSNENANIMEVPIMDGSASPFIFLIQAAGIKKQEAPKKFIRIKKTILVEEGDKYAKLEPYEGFKISFTIDFDHPIIQAGGQFASFDLLSTSYIKEISRARTFGFLSQAEQLQKLKLAQGANLYNAIVLDKMKIINKDKLRYTNEFVRHKILDAIGDLYLLGHKIVGSFHGHKSGHYLNKILTEALLADPSAWELVTYENLV